MQKTEPLTLPPWTDPPADLRLEKGQVHLWRLSLDLPSHELNSLQRLLSEDELARAHRLIDPLKADRFIAARGRLRQLLARYTRTEPSALSFVYGSSGKPALEGGWEIGFNLSHSQSWALLAVAGGCDVGVDLEVIDPSLAFEPIAATFFSAIENAWLERFAPHRRRRAFYRLWTRKEAWLKGLGWGFSGPASCIDMAGGLRGAGGWSMKNLPVARGVVGALAVEEEFSDIRCWQG